ncbi:MAG: hypothetical protein PUC55_07105 [Lachnospiraceae bacterium]|nr:hypothetical protein [Lachnospiraceae bacterium]HCJ07502.1 hypothetical protein [Lachnospiraceae bacterium]
MEIGGYGYEKPEYVRLAEQIYQCKNDKEALELELNNTRFHYDYIKKRKGLVKHEVVFRMIYIIVLAVFLYICMNSFFIFATPFVLYGEWKLITRECKMLFMLSYNWKPEHMRWIAEHFDIDTFQNDTIRTEKKIEALESQIAVCEKKLQTLNKSREDLIRQRQQQEDVLRKYGVLYDTDPKKQNSKFSLKEEDSWVNDIQELDEYYRKEEGYLKQLISHVDNTIERYNKEITEIDQQFDTAKKLLIFAAIIFVLIVVLQNALHGVAYTISSIVCVIISMIAILYLERRCKQPILAYLVEQNKPIVADYAFTHGLVPVAEKRREYIENKEKYEKELAEVQKKRRELDQ